MSPGEDIRADALNEAAHTLRQRAITVGIEHGDYAAKIVIDDAVLISDLADEYPVYTHSHGYGRDAALDQVHADKYHRLLAFLQDHRSRSVDWALNQHFNGGRG